MFHASWGPIAARDAALALAAFRASLKAIGEALKGVRSLRGTQARLKPVERRFAAEFPMVRAGRAAANGHANGEAPPRGRGAMSDAILLAEIAHEGRNVQHRSEGRELRFELSERSLWRLVALRDAAFAAFEGG